MRLAGICLITKDVPALAGFYARVLGVEATGDAVHMEVRSQGAGLAIFSIGGMEEMAPHSMEGAGVGNVTLMFEVEDADVEYERLLALGGIDFVKLPKTHPWGARSFWFRDPDGNIVDFYAHQAPPTS